jgi:putative flippase GtrA
VRSSFPEQTFAPAPVQEQDFTYQTNSFVPNVLYRPKARRSWHNLLMQLGRFGMVGAFNTILDLLLFNVLLWSLPTQNTMLILVYNSIAYSIGAFNSFLLNKYWTFQRKHTATPGEVFRFILTTAAGVLCSDLILWLASLLLSHLSGNTALLNNMAKLLAVGGTAGISYFGMRAWVFVRKAEA